MSTIEFEPSYYEDQEQQETLSPERSEVMLKHHYWRSEAFNHDEIQSHVPSFSETFTSLVFLGSVGIKLPQTEAEKENFLGGIITAGAVSRISSHVLPSNPELKSNVGLPTDEASKLLHIAAMTEAEARSKFFSNVDIKQKREGLNIDNSEAASHEIESIKEMIKHEKENNSLFEIVDRFLSHFELDPNEKELIKFDLVKVIAIRIFSAIDLEKNELRDENNEARMHLENGQYREALEALGQASRNPETEQIIKDTVRDVLTSWQTHHQNNNSDQEPLLQTAA